MRHSVTRGTGIISREGNCRGGFPQHPQQNPQERLAGQKSAGAVRGTKSKENSDRVVPRNGLLNTSAVGRWWALAGAFADAMARLSQRVWYCAAELMAGTAQCWSLLLVLAQQQLVGGYRFRDLFAFKLEFKGEGVSYTVTISQHSF